MNTRNRMTDLKEGRESYSKVVSVETISNFEIFCTEIILSKVIVIKSVFGPEIYQESMLCFDKIYQI